MDALKVSIKLQMHQNCQLHPQDHFKDKKSNQFNVRGMGGKTALMNACEIGYFQIAEAIMIMNA